ncbi:MAG TPA: DUF3185 family protein [Fibrobacteria bacterium]|jgi:hypothetical protein|nr:DUF3185 family protein [Fibrobacteria bacterium]
MLKGLYAALALVGIVLIVWGVRVYRSFGSEVTEAVTGAPSDEAIWLLVLGTLGTFAGLFGLISRGR